MKITEICNILEELYPDAKCSLDYVEDYQLIIAARLSAQCTDERVNKITPALFRRYKSLEEFANSDINELEEMVHSCGFYHSKAKDIKALCGKLAELGYIPETIEELVKLPGIGRKTANLIMGDIHHKPAIVADTHFIRITGRLGLTKNTIPAKVEADLRKIIPPALSNDFCHRIVYFGRDICKARNPECSRCPARKACLRFENLLVLEQ
jgi:endonuclease-3